MLIEKQYDETAGACDTVDRDDDWTCSDPGEWRARVWDEDLEREIPLTLCTDHMIALEIEHDARLVNPEYDQEDDEDG